MGTFIAAVQATLKDELRELIATELPSLPAHQVKVFPRILEVREFAFVA
jgi:hypothetical protein